MLPHPKKAMTVAGVAGSAMERIALIGALSPHRGSGKLREIAARARLTHPALHFEVIGHTDDDERFEALPNVTGTGRYGPGQLAGRIRRSGSNSALFLHVWPETFPYTLSEAVRYSLLPVVPDLGAPAERVRDSGFGIVFPYPCSAATVLDALDRAIAEPQRHLSPERAARMFASGGDRSRRTADLYALRDGNSSS